MRAIIIQDSDARALLDQLKLEAMTHPDNHRDWSNPDKPASTATVHRAFHYVVCRWLQEMGCDVVR